MNYCATISCHYYYHIQALGVFIVREPDIIVAAFEFLFSQLMDVAISGSFSASGDRISDEAIQVTQLQ